MCFLPNASYLAPVHELPTSQSLASTACIGAALVFNSPCSPAILSGDGFSPRHVDAILHGCIPVVVMDNVTEGFDSLLDWKQFSVRIAEADIERTPEILLSISDPLLLQMQASLAKVWHRFAWMGSALHHSTLPHIYEANKGRGASAPELPPTHPFRRRQRYPVHEDAFATLMTWLHGRIADTR